MGSASSTQKRSKPKTNKLDLKLNLIKQCSVSEGKTIKEDENWRETFEITKN